MVAFPEIALDDTIRTTGYDVLPPAMGQSISGQYGWMYETPQVLANSEPAPIAIKNPPVFTGPPVLINPPGTLNPTGTATTNTPVTGVAWPTRRGGAIRPVIIQGSNGQAVQPIQAQTPAPSQALTPNQTLNLAGTVAGIPVWAIGAVVVVGFLFLMGGKK